jgi:hypothetical protein
MRIIAITPLPVKPTRISPRPAAKFGAGILPTYPTHRLPVLVSDLDAAAAMFADDARIDWDAIFTALEEQDLIDAGYACC